MGSVHGRRGRAEYYGRTAKVGALWGVVRQGGNELLAVPTSIIMARLLAPREFGVAAAATFFVVLAARMSEFGFNAALVRSKSLRPEHVSSVFVLKLVVGALTWLVLSAASPLVGAFYEAPEAGWVLPLAAIVFVITPFGTIPAALMQRNMQFRQLTISDWVDSLTQACVTIGLALAGFSFWSLIWGYVAGALANALTKMFLAGWTPSLRFSLAAIRELVSYGLGVQFKRLLEYSAQNLDNLVVGKTLGMAALGLYDKAFTTMGRIVNRTILGGSVSFRIFAIIWDQPERFRRAYGKVITTTTLISIPVLGVCIVMAQELFLLLYGSQWTLAVEPFRILCLAGVLKVINSCAHRANEASGMIWWQVAIQALYVVSVVVGVVVGSRFGLGGAAVGVLIATPLHTALTHVLLRASTGLRARDMLIPQLPGWLCAFGTILVVGAARQLLRLTVADPAAWHFVLAGGTAAVLFYLGFLIVAPIAAVREIVAESLNDLVPGLAKRFPRLSQLPEASGPTV